ncbi:hypothetical protein predicted by Glimmer/Critica [Acetobacter ghanensis]|uniref:Uncharacterized protein n=1 Tax=Acetobacter ghanensis TaxID=431306 RepID=A0A0U5F3J7_9PROT|nr:hypothetical protein predicted by Glimmer/Critica [Acetobacter ghanensis]
MPARQCAQDLAAGAAAISLFLSWYLVIKRLSDNRFARTHKSTIGFLAA